LFSSANLSSVTYNLFQDQIIQEKTEKEQRLYDLRKKLSNSEMFINEAIEIARNIQYYWDSSDLETKLKLRKTVFPKGLVRALLRKAQTATQLLFFISIRL
jgi:hypothetical protein